MALMTLPTRTVLSSHHVNKGRVELGMSRSAPGCTKFGHTEGPNDKGTSYFCLIVSFQSPAETHFGENQNYGSERGKKCKFLCSSLIRTLISTTADFSHCPDPEKHTR